MAGQPLHSGDPNKTARMNADVHVGYHPHREDQDELNPDAYTDEVAAERAQTLADEHEERQQRAAQSGAAGQEEIVFGHSPGTQMYAGEAPPQEEPNALEAAAPAPAGLTQENATPEQPVEQEMAQAQHLGADQPSPEYVSEFEADGEPLPPSDGAQG